MKVILLRDVPNTGRKGEVKEVNQGHAMNFLIPRKLAKPVSDSQISQLNVLKEQQKERSEVEKDLAIKELLTLKGQIFTMTAKANDKGHLFSQIHAADVVQTLSEQSKVAIPASAVEIPHSIKETGEIALTLSLYDVKVPVTLKIEALR